MLNNKKSKLLIQILIILTIILLVIKIKPTITPILEIIGMLISPIIIGGFFYYALRPLKNFLLKLVKHSGVAAFLSILLVLVIISVVIIYGGDIVIDQFEDAFVKNQDKLIEYKEYLDEKIQEILPNLDIFSRISNNIKSFATSIGSNAMGIFSGIGNIGTQIVLIPFILFYLLKEDKIFKDKLFNKIPKKHKFEIKDMFIKTDKILSTYINGQLLVALIIGVLMFIGYLIIGMPNALLMASFSLITSIIPFIGPFLGVIPALLIALTMNFGLVMKIIVTAVIVQQLEGNLITPNIMGNKLKLHPLAVIFIVIISIKLFGILGAFIGTPLFLTLVTISKTVYSISKKAGSIKQ